MTSLEGLSCEICLRADEAESMLSVAIPYAAHNPDRAVVICRRCAREVAGASFAADQDNAPPEEEHGA